MANIKYLSENGLIYFWSLLKEKLNTKVDSVAGKTLTSNDLTDALKAQYDAAQANTIESIKLNNVEQTPTGKVVNLTVITSSEVDTKISTALAGVTSFSFEIVSTLPSSGDANKIYLLSKEGTAPDVYDEYIWVNNAWEKIGTTAIDLSGYVQASDLVAITNTEIDVIIAM